MEDKLPKSVVLQVTNDEFEWVVQMFDSPKELAKALGISADGARKKIARSKNMFLGKYRKYKYIRVRLEESEANETNND